MSFPFFSSCLCDHHKHQMLALTIITAVICVRLCVCAEYLPFQNSDSEASSAHCGHMRAASARPLCSLPALLLSAEKHCKH